MKAPNLELLRRLSEHLSENIKGQDHVINPVCSVLRRGELGLASSRRPRGSFLFVGPTGVGKTEITNVFTEYLFKGEKPVRFDMSEYQTHSSVEKLIGEKVGDVGLLGRALASVDHGTLLFDEIEKAHPRVLDVLLQLLDAARLTTGRNRVLDFSAWYVVLTSNIGAQRIMTLRKSKYETMERLVRQDAQRELRPEIFARITLTVVFNKLDYEAQCAIAAGLVEKECRTLAGLGYRVSSEPSVQGIVVSRGYHERLGARPMRDAAELLVRNALARELLRGGDGSGRLLPHSDGMKLHLNPAAS